MASIERCLEILDKAHTGPTCTAKEWGFRLSKKMAEKLKKFGIVKTCDRQVPINTDDELADRFFKAGFELAFEMGVFCQDTDRIIGVTEDDLAKACKAARSELELGKGKERVILKHRRPEDKQPPLAASPMSHLISEDIYVCLHQAIAKTPEIDMLRSGTVSTVYGRPVLAGTPYETAVGFYQAQLTREALLRAGRPGMCNLAIASSPTAYGQLGGFGLRGGADPEIDVALVLAPGELTTSYEVLHKVIQAVNCGAKLATGYCSMIGCFSGPPEGAAVSRIATVLHQFALYQTDFQSGSILDVRYLGSSGREAQWADSVSNQAISRNTHFLDMSAQNELGGPCTEMLLYECAVATINLAVSGVSGVVGPRTSGSKYADHVTPLECKFSAEVLKASAGMTRRRANEIVREVIPRYESTIHNPTKGKSFRECYDLEKLEPTQEWFDLYLKMKNELISLGVPLEYS